MKDKLSLPQLRKLLQDKLIPSSLQTLTFYQLRQMFNCNHITDSEFIGICKALHLEIFGSSGVWAKLK